MRDYGVISPKFWIGGTGKALRGNAEAQLVAVYLMTSPHANMIGVFYCPLDTIAKETGLPIEGASKGLRSLIEADFCQFDRETEEVFVIRMAAYQVGEQLEAKDNRCKGVARELERVMSDLLKAAFRAIYSVAFHLPPPPIKAAPAAPSAPPPGSPSEAPSKPETGTEAETGTGTGAGDSANAGGKPPKLTDPKEIIFGYGLSLLVNAGTPEKTARSFLGGRASEYSDAELVDVLRDCAKAKTLQPLEWIAKAMPPKGGKGRRPTSHNGLANKDYHQGVTPDGTLV